MVETSNINVAVTKKEECIYRNSVKNEGNDLNSLILNLNSIRQKVNEVLTELVQIEQSTNETSNDNDDVDDDEEASEEDNSDDNEENAKAKKYKFN